MTEEIMSNTQVALNVEGMHCGSCAKLVERALKGTRGVTSATVLLAKQQAVVEYDPQQVTLDVLEQAVVAQGYSVTDAVPVAKA
jgi:copper chaperone CopZ